jgi:hypothetical protein
MVPGLVEGSRSTRSIDVGEPGAALTTKEPNTCSTLQRRLLA